MGGRCSLPPSMALVGPWWNSDAFSVPLRVVPHTLPARLSVPVSEDRWFVVIRSLDEVAWNHPQSSLWDERYIYILHPSGPTEVPFDAKRFAQWFTCWLWARTPLPGPVSDGYPTPLNDWILDARKNTFCDAWTKHRTWMARNGNGYHCPLSDALGVPVQDLAISDPLKPIAGYRRLSESLAIASLITNHGIALDTALLIAGYICTPRYPSGTIHIGPHGGCRILTLYNGPLYTVRLSPPDASNRAYGLIHHDHVIPTFPPPKWATHDSATGKLCEERASWLRPNYNNRGGWVHKSGMVVRPLSYRDIGSALNARAIWAQRTIAPGRPPPFLAGDMPEKPKLESPDDDSDADDFVATLPPPKPKPAIARALDPQNVQRS